LFYLLKLSFDLVVIGGKWYC